MNYYSRETLERMMKDNGGWLYLRGTQITALPDNLTVGGSLDLSGTQITALPAFMTIFFAILLFSFLIFIHELGHFLAAKASGVRVNEFSMFMGPAIFKKQVGRRCMLFAVFLSVAIVPWRAKMKTLMTQDLSKKHLGGSG